MDRVHIASLGLYHPDRQIDNEFFINKFSAAGIEIGGLLQALGRDKRYIIDKPEENTLTMSVIAARRALALADVAAEDLDTIVFTSQTPEYLIPATALKIHHALQGGKQALCYDLNANCAGLIVAMEQVCRSMMANPASQCALVVGGDYLSVHSPDEPVYCSNFADSAVAVILRKGTAGRGFIDSTFRCQTTVIDNSLFPGYGLSQLHQKDKPAGVRFQPFDDAVCVASAVEGISSLLARHAISTEDIKGYMFSQFSPGNITRVCEGLGVSVQRAIYIGDSFGYTATNSPLLALHQAASRESIQRGDLLVFWTVGAGWQNAVVLMEY